MFFYEELISYSLREERIYFNNSEIVIDKTIENLKKDMLSSEKEKTAVINIGEEIKISDNSTQYPGFLGIVKSIKDQQVEVDIFIFEHSVTLTLDLSEIEKIEEKNKL